MEREGSGVERHFPLVWSLVNRLGVRGPEREDLFAAGCLGLVKAWKRYDPARGTAFSTYAVPVILGEMRRHLREATGVKMPGATREMVARAREVRALLAQEKGAEPSLGEVAAALGVEPADLVAAEEAYLPPRSLEEGAPLARLGWGPPGDASRAGDPPAGGPPDEETLDLALALARLEPREQAIVRGRYFEDLTQEEMATRLGISQPQVSRLEQRALARLREILAWHTSDCDRHKLVVVKEADAGARGQGAGTGGKLAQ